MRCPVCNYKETKVNDSRVNADGSTVRRRRECAKCGFRFSTMEEIEILELIVVKRNGRRESYSREKIISGLKRALQKRPHTNEAFLSLVHSIERDIQKKRKHEIKSEEIGEIIMNRLRAFDKVAYIRFASVYRSFEDVESFKKEIEGLKRRAKARNKK
jgi:transcriptional repressor NrdR